MIISLILFLKFINLTTSQDDCQFNFEIVSDISPATCDSENKYYEEEECFPYCKDFPTSGNGKCNATTPCIPGYKCVSNKCQADGDSCAIYHANTKDNVNNYYSSVFKPNCAKDGSWLPKQCKGELTTGRCFCYDSIGNRLFGQAWTTDADDMTCACSRQRADLLSGENPKLYVSLHCDSMGNFEPLQCDSGQCWCVDGKTGDLTSPVVPEKAMVHLDCYDRTTVGSKYLRQCDSQKYAQAKITEIFNLHGTVTVNFPVLNCDDDGSYGSYRISDGIAYCNWRDNTNLGTWQSEATSISTINCNCARDSKYFAIAGLTQTQLCSGNGNYKTFQKFGTTAYCIDQDGYGNSTNTPETETDCIKTY